MNEKQYKIAIVLLFIATVICLWILFTLPPKPVCDRTHPTAGEILDCMATRTMETMK